MILKTDISFIYTYTYNTFQIIKTLMYHVLLKLATHMHAVHMYTCTVKLMHVNIHSFLLLSTGTLFLSINKIITDTIHSSQL